MLSHNDKYVENPVKYNQDIRDWRWKNRQHVGCVNQWACENCGLLVSDSICLCVGVFTCPKCDFVTGSIPKYEPGQQLDFVLFRKDGIVATYTGTQPHILTDGAGI